MLKLLGDVFMPMSTSHDASLTSVMKTETII